MQAAEHTARHHQLNTQPVTTICAASKSWYRFGVLSSKVQDAVSVNVMPIKHLLN